MFKALDVIVANRSWCGSWLLDAGIIEPEEAVCTRCGLNFPETPHHRYYTCSANEHITAEEVTSTQQVCEVACMDKAHERMWPRGIMPGAKSANM